MPARLALLVSLAAALVAATVTPSSAAPVDSRAVTQLRATATDSVVSLSWRAPSAPHITAVVVRRAVGLRAPKGPTDGALVASVPPAQVGLRDGGRAALTAYSYSVFTYQSGRVTGAPVTITARTRAYPGPATSLQAAATTPTKVLLMWANPASPDFAGVTVRRAVGGVAPPSATAGIAVTETTSSAVLNSGLWPGTEYSFALFSHDRTGHFSPAATVTVTTPPTTTPPPAFWRPAQTIGTDPLGDVSCASPTFCVALSSNGAVTTYDGTVWSSQAPVFPVINEGIPEEDAFVAVSCPTTTFCAAVDGVNASLYRNGVWSAPIQIVVRGPEDGTGSKPRDLTALSCVSPSFCVAGVRSGAVLTYNGTGWGSPVALGDGILPHGLSCTSVSFCVALTGLDSRTFDGVSWLAPVNQASPGDAILSMSCSSAAFCMVLTSAGVNVFNGSTWTVSTIPFVYSGFFAYAVSCTSSTSCMAVDDIGGASIYNGVKWTGPTVITSQDAIAPQAVSCASARFCVAVQTLGDEAAVYR